MSEFGFLTASAPNGGAIVPGVTPIIGGAVGQILFQGSGNVIQESPNLFWDNTNGRLGIGGTPGAFTLDVNGNTRVIGPSFVVGDWASRSTSVYVRAATGGSELRGFLIGYGASNDGNAGSFTYNPTGNLLNIRSPYNSGTIALSFEGNTNSTQFHNTSGVVHSKIFANTGNWGINTTTDAGFRLDVNGTARVVGNTLLDSGIIATSGATTRLQGSINYFTHNRIGSSGALGFQISSYGTLASFFRWSDATYDTEIGGAGSPLIGGLKFFTAGTEKTRITSGGNVLINTTTDDGFRLDVNGTARVSGLLTIQNLTADLYVRTTAWSGQSRIWFGDDSSDTIGGINYEHQFDRMNLRTNAGTRMTLYSTGNIGINTTTDAGFRLDVNGTVRVADNNQLGWGNGNYFIANNATPKIDCYVQSSLILTLGQSTMTFGVAARTRELTASSDATFDFGSQFNRYRHGWLSGQLKVGDATAVNASAKVQIDSTTQGFLPPRQTQAQRTAIASPAAGLMVYDTDLNRPCFYNGTTWITL